MKFKRLFLILPLVILTAFCGCSAGYEYQRSNFINVTVADGEHYYLRKNSYSLERGGDLSVTAVFRDGFIPDGCSYENYELVKVSANEYRLMLYGLRYPEFIKIGETNGNEAIRYFANGGEYIGEKPVEWYIKGEISKTHLRTNTDLGFGVARKGYVLTGWNTMADGSGVHAGLGSRITVNENGATELFAEWERITNIDNFEYVTKNGELFLTGYTGDKAVEKLVLPDEIDGYAVTGVAPGFCGRAAVGRLVIPKTVKTVEDGAFTDCGIEDFCFFDSLSNISDESFKNCRIGRVHINAASYPRYQSNTEISYFADAIDRLIALKDKKKMIFFSGCSFAYGLDSRAVASEVGNEYQVLNLGIIGGTNAGFQFDIISHFVGEGDVFIHAPEPASPFQLMADNSAEIRMFVVTEGNYDLLSLADISAIDGFFTEFAAYCKNREQLDAESYDGFSDVYNEFGDVIKPRRFTGEDRPFTEDFSYSFKPDFINMRTADLLCGYYGKLQSKGVKVAVSYSPINFHGLPAEDREEHTWEKFERNFTECLFREHGVEIISDVKDYIFAGRYFYDTDYHLNDEGVKIRTERLLRDMKAHGICGGNV